MAYISRCVPDLLPAHLGSIPTKNGMAISAGAMEMTPNNPSPPSAAATDEAAFEALRPRAWIYRYSDPMTGEPVWRRDGDLWNGQRPTKQEPLFDLETIRAFLAGRSSQRPSPSVGREEIAADKELGRLEKFADEAEVRARQGFGYAVPLAATPGFARRLRSVVQSVRDYRAAVERLTVAQGRAWDEGAAIGRQLERDALAQPATVAVEGMTHPASDALGAWMSAALDDPSVCAEMKRDITAWFEAGQPLPTLPPGEWTDEQVEAAARAYHEDLRREFPGTAASPAPAWDGMVITYRDSRLRAMRAALVTITPTAGGK